MSEGTPPGEAGPRIPAASLPLSARAPGKCIVFGEHGVVHGTPELVFAIDLETQVLLRATDRWSLNGDAAAAETHPYLRAAVARFAGRAPTAGIRAVSRIPRSAGLGSSAAFVAALAAALGALGGGIDRTALADAAFAVERDAQGVGSPGDTSASVAGGFVTINGPPGAPLLWTIERDGRRWEVRRAPDPAWTWIVAYSGIPRSTATAVESVSRRLGAPDGPELLRRFRQVAEEGLRAIAAEDRTATGRAMQENHALLETVGVGHPRLTALRKAVAECSAGAKLTGAGAGGSIVVLPKEGREAECVRRLARAGALAFAVRPSGHGAGLIGPVPP
ncbi:MAG: hypothetical protein QXG65_03545 [Thermoplasmata archaeon]